MSILKTAIVVELLLMKGYFMFGYFMFGYFMNTFPNCWLGNV